MDPACVLHSVVYATDHIDGLMWPRHYQNEQLTWQKTWCSTKIFEGNLISNHYQRELVAVLCLES